jgi:Spy/CpxP family protein refolding chaperone
MGPAGLFDLTADQRTAIQAIERTARDQSAAVSDELEFARRALRREVFADARNAGTVQTLASKIATLEKQLFDLRLKTDVAVADVLTPTQRERMRIQGGRTGQPGFGGRGRGPGRSGAGPA